MKYDHFKSYKVTLTALSPVFIGDGGTLNKINYIFDASKKPPLLQVVDESKWAEVLQKDDKLLDDFARDCAAGRLTDFRTWAINHKITPPYKYKMPVFKEEDNKPNQGGYQRGGTPKKAPTMNDVKTFIKSPDGNPYIPGSSLKGAIRTAIFSKRVAGKGRHVKEEEIFGSIDKSDFKYMSISDSLDDINKSCLYVGQRIDYALAKKKETKDLYLKISPMSVYAEFLKPGAKASFKMTLYDNKFSKNDIMVALSDFAKRQKELISVISEKVKFEKDFAEANLCLGGFAGYFSKGVIYDMLGFDAGVRELKGLFSKKFPRHHHEDIDKICPHALKLTKYNGKSYLIGWCRLDIE